MASTPEVGILPTPPTTTTNPAARVLLERLGGKVRKVDDWRGDLALTLDREAWVEACTLLRDHPELDFKLFLHLFGVDYLHDRENPLAGGFHTHSPTPQHHI